MMRIRLYKYIVVLILSVLGVNGYAQPAIRYVMPNGTGNGTSWTSARADVQGAINDLQALIASDPSVTEGQVWVAAGTYSPTELVSTGDSKMASFILYSGISLYGGFAGTESAIEQRVKSSDTNVGIHPWGFAHESRLTGDLTSTEATFVYDSANEEYEVKFVNNVYHVVWFATNGFTGSRANALTGISVVDGFTICHGNAFQTVEESHISKGGGVYMVEGAVLRNSIVKENQSALYGGGIYVDGGGDIDGCLVVENQCVGNALSLGYGGGIAVHDRGRVINTLVANNVGRTGGGVALYNSTASMDVTQMALVNSLVANNNSSIEAGGVSLFNGGVVNQSTVVRNYCSSVGTLYQGVLTGRTGGLYLYRGGVVANSVFWGNDAVSQSLQFYLQKSGTTAATVYNSGFSSADIINWDEIDNKEIYALAETNTGTSSDLFPAFTEVPDDISSIKAGVCQTTLASSNRVATYLSRYNWTPDGNSAFREKGMPTSESSLILPPKAQVDEDMLGNSYAIKSDLGALNANSITVQYTREGTIYNIYVEPDRENINSAAGESWSNPVSSLNDALIFCKNNPITGNNRYRIHVKEGTVYTYGQYVTDDVRSATLYVTDRVEIWGGYSAAEANPTARNPLSCRTLVSGDIGEVDDYTDNSYHCIVVAPGSKNVVLDGLHVVFGNTEGGSATFRIGAGILVDEEASVTITNCIVENCTAQSGAAIYIHDGASFAMTNSIVNNNTATDNSSPSAIHFNTSAASGSTITSSTIVKNIGVGIRNDNSSVTVNNCWVWSNRVGENNYIPFVGAFATTYCVVDEGTTISGTGNLAVLTHDRNNNSGYTYPVTTNETKDIGANQAGFDTYYGGYANWTPTNMSPVVNTGSLIGMTDMLGNTRNYGGAADVGALENTELPQSGTIYVREADGDDNNNGNSWSTAYKTVIKALQVATSGSIIWVAEGEYTGQHTMKEGVDVYGGFPGHGSPGHTERDPILHPSYIQAKAVSPITLGDRAPANVTYNGGYGQAYPGDGSRATIRTLVQSSNFAVETVWDGLVIRHGMIYGAVNYNANSQFTYNASIINSGGAGVLLRGNGVLRNCEVSNNMIFADNQNTSSGGWHAGGAGVFCLDGRIENCRIIENVIRQNSSQLTGDLQRRNSKWCYGSGLYLVKVSTTPTVFNTVVSDNYAITYQDRNPGNNPNIFSLGAVWGANECNFFNNTVVNNKAHVDIDNASSTYLNRTYSCPGVFILREATVYNSIVANNESTSVIGSGSVSSTQGLVSDNRYQMMSANDGNLILKPADKVYYSCLYYPNVEITSSQVNMGGYNIHNTNPLLTSTYQLNFGSPCINAGTENVGGAMIPDRDAAYTDRIKDCVIDMGAFEYDGRFNIVGTDETENGKTWYTYYVTQNGGGTASANSPTNAACATKLQDILDAAGRYKRANSSANVRVKLAEHVYLPTRKTVQDYTTQAWSDDELTYSFFIPRGITLLGGYDTGFTQRNVVTQPTYLSGNRQNASSIAQYMYHVVTFTQRVYADGSDTRWSSHEPLNVSGYTTTLDGIYLVEGNASGQLSEHKRGGGAVVPEYVHIRNCIVQYCTASEQGGGLYLMPGATVSGTLVTLNRAKFGGGIYVAPFDNDTSDKPAKIFTSSIIYNSTSTGGRGGGLHFGAANTYLNSCVIWRNTANTGKNVYGVTDQTVTIELDGIVDGNGIRRSIHYPFNYSAVEAIRQPGENNIQLEAENENSVNYLSTNVTQFASFARPNTGSKLINAGVPSTIWSQVRSQFNLAQFDYANCERGITNLNVDIGARVSQLSVFSDTNPVFTRLFVTEGNHIIPSDERYGLNGTCFRNPFTSLEEALEYILMVRTCVDSSLRFEIFMAGGNYYPFSAPGGYSVNLRKSAFTIPQGVAIFGGFDGSKGGFDWDYYQPLGHAPGIDTGFDLSKKPTNMISTADALLARELTDINRNGLFEPWELRRQTILNAKVNSHEGARDAYHILYNDALSNTGNTCIDKTVVLDGIYFINGEGLHANDVDGVDRDAESYFKGGAIYIGDPNTPLVIRRSQFVDNQGRQGGAIYSEGSVYSYSNLFVQNAALKEEGITNSKDGCGSVIFTENSKFYAYNSIFANNESEAMATIYGGNKGLFTMNCNMVRNKAASYPAAYFVGTHSGEDNIHANSIFWGNESTSDNLVQNGLLEENGYKRVVFSAYESSQGPSPTFNASVDERENTAILTTGLTANNNVVIDSRNWSLDGPCFNNPSTVAGVNGYNIGNSWSINTQSVMLDGGWGKMEQHFSSEDIPYFTGNGSGAYYNLATGVNVPFESVTWGWIPYMHDHRYMMRTSGTETMRISTDPNPTQGQTYIDIGAYEYQHVKLELKTETLIDTIYVRTHENQDVPADGTTWERATSNLQRAIETLLASRNGRKKMIFMAEGEYAPTYMISGNRGFTINNNVLAMLRDNTGAEPPSKPINDLIIRGGYSDTELDNRRRDYSRHKTIIKAMPNRGTKNLFHLQDLTYGNGKYSIGGIEYGTEYSTLITERILVKELDHPRPSIAPVTNTIAEKIIKEKSIIPVAFEGIIFANEHSSEEGALFKVDQDMQGCLVFNACEFMLSGKQVASPKAAVSATGAKILNSLFHSNKGNPLSVKDTEIMNSTFANNGSPITFPALTNSSLTNSVFWNNVGDNSFSNAILGYNAIEGYTSGNLDSNTSLSSDNNDLLEGPNFINPAVATTPGVGYDFSLNASLKLLDTGDGELTSITTETIGETHMNSSVSQGTGAYFALLTKEINGDVTFGAVGEITNVRNLLDPAYNTPYIDNKVFGEIDMNFTDRFYGATSDARRIDKGAFEFDKQLRDVLYVDPRSAVSGDGSSWTAPLLSLQSAIDLAFVKANNSDTHAYVLAKRGNTSEEITARRGTTVFGSIQANEERLAEDMITSSEELVEGVRRIAASRPGLLETGTNRTLLKSLQTQGFDQPIPVGLSTDAVFSFFDGFEITENNSATATVSIDALPFEAGGVAYNPFIFRNNVIWGNENSATGTISESSNNLPIVYNKGGLLYNNLIHGNTVASTDYPHVVNVAPGRMVNNTIETNSAYTLNTYKPTGYAGDYLYNNLLRNGAGTMGAVGLTDNEAATSIGAGFLNPYFERVYGNNNHLAYQLVERVDDDNSPINNGTTSFTHPGISYSTDRDLLGNNRIYDQNLIDIGCFETIRVPKDTDEEFCLTGNHYPHSGSVVYALEGATISLKSTDYPMTFTPDYLLLEKGAQLFGNGKNVSLRYLAVEKQFGPGYNLFSLPYAVNFGYSGTVQGGVTTAGDQGTSVTLDLYQYDGASRAASLNKYHEADSPYWTKVTDAYTRANKGYYPDTNGGNGLTEPSTYRFTANESAAVYEEGDVDKTVELQQYNLTSAPNVQFTYKENMGWNLFGSPYLCRYDWSKMNNPHILYGYENGAGYKSFYSWEPNTGGGTSTVELPLHGAYFTQTAIINGPEVVKFPSPIKGDGQSTATTRALLLQVSEESVVTGDQVAIFASASPANSLQYRYGEDAVKMMAEEELPQLYVSNGDGNRFSIITSADTEGATPLGISVAKAGNYRIELPETSQADYEYVVLADNQTGKAVDLREEDYCFVASEAADDPTRFTLTFKQLEERTAQTPYVYTLPNGFCVARIDVGDKIEVYDAAGRLITERIARSQEEKFDLLRGIYLIKLLRLEHKNWTTKVSVK